MCTENFAILSHHISVSCVRCNIEQQRFCELSFTDNGFRDFDDTKDEFSYTSFSSFSFVRLLFSHSASPSLSLSACFCFSCAALRLICSTQNLFTTTSTNIQANTNAQIESKNTWGDRGAQHMHWLQLICTNEMRNEKRNEEKQIRSIF